MLPAGEEAFPVKRNAALPMEAERYLFSQGLLQPKRMAEQTKIEVLKSFWANAAAVIRACDDIFAANPKARVCIIGSESAFAWSYDGAYAAAKAALHRYVETKRLQSPDQQLICIAPSIIGDAQMTVSRRDHDGLVQRMAAHPKRRWLEAAEVAALVHHCLYVDRGYLSGVVIRLNGGAHCG